MNTTASGSEPGRKAYSATIQAKAYSTSSCAFCWFFVGLYPEMKGIAPRDEATYREHLTRSHGLVDAIHQ